MIQIFNTMTGKKETFQTLKPNEVSMYVCGPTVYDFLHIGNFRGAIFFNVVRNWLEKSGYKVHYIYNYTDVEDKIIQRANQEGKSAQEVAETYIQEFERDYKSLKLRPHSRNPRVTEHMDDIVSLIQTLIEKEKAYEIEGDIYFSIKDFKDYGKLSHKNLEDLEAGYRIEVNQKKKHPEDFVLWKKAKEGEPAWPSPWSEGRPGWHIECSAMNKALFGDQIDIHGGGLDLVFPHHENEIAQTEAATGKTFARYWMHNNMLTFGAQKMSKSLGNIKKGREFIEEYNPEILKGMMLSSHYRSLIDFSEDHIQQVIQMLGRIYSSLAHASELAQGESGEPASSFKEATLKFDKEFAESLDDDFNTAEVFGKVFDLVRHYNNIGRKPGKVKPDQVGAAKLFLQKMKEVNEIMALFGEEPKAFLESLDNLLLKKKDLKREDIDRLVKERAKARADKDFATSDQLRDKLNNLGILVSDGPSGSTWEVNKGAI